MSDGLKALMQKHAEELEREQAAHRDALALCEVYEARIAALQSQLDAARAGSYVPLPDGTYHTDGPEVIYVKDALLNILGETYVYLQQGYALCKLQPGSPQAGTWQPIEDGEYTMPAWDDLTYTLHVTHNGAELEAWGNADENKYKDGSPKRVEEIGVGDYRLCKLQPVSDNGAQDA